MLRGCLGVRSTFPPVPTGSVGIPVHLFSVGHPPEILYLGVFGHGPLEQRTATNNVLNGMVGDLLSTLVVGGGGWARLGRLEIRLGLLKFLSIVQYHISHHIPYLT